MVVNSHDAAKDFAGWPKPYLDRLSLIEHGFADKTSKLSKAQAREALAERVGFAIAPDVPVVGAVARLTQTKNVGVLIGLLEREPSWRAVVVGQGPEREALLAQAAARGVGDRFHLIGEMAPDRVGDALAAMDLFVFASRAETFGLAAVEAAQTGLPVLCNDIPVMRETLTLADGRPCALFVDVEDAQALHVAARRAMTDEALRAALSSAGKSLSHRYSLAAMVDGYEREIALALESRRLR
jgi:glycosyltransferase involved in cell wall biosynthesis